MEFRARLAHPNQPTNQPTDHFFHHHQLCVAIMCLTQGPIWPIFSSSSAMCGQHVSQFGLICFILIRFSKQWFYLGEPPHRPRAQGPKGSLGPRPQGKFHHHQNRGVIGRGMGNRAPPNVVNSGECFNCFVITSHVWPSGVSARGPLSQFFNHHRPCVAIMCHSLASFVSSSSDFPSSGFSLVTPHE